MRDGVSLLGLLSSPSTRLADMRRKVSQSKQTKKRGEKRKKKREPVARATPASPSPRARWPVHPRAGVLQRCTETHPYRRPAHHDRYTPGWPRRTRGAHERKQEVQVSVRPCVWGREVSAGERGRETATGGDGSEYARTYANGRPSFASLNCVLFCFALSVRLLLLLRPNTMREEERESSLRLG